MLSVLAVRNFRSLRDLKLPAGPLTVITGANGSGKSNLYRALRLLAAAAEGRIAEVMAHEGGIPSAQWAGPADLRGQLKRRQPIQGTARKEPLRISFGFASDDCAYELSLGVPKMSTPVPKVPSKFALDPEIKEEHIWQAPPRRRANLWLQREGPQISARDVEGVWQRVAFVPSAHRSVLTELVEPERYPEVLLLRERIRGWRFYDAFRTDADSPLRHPRIAVQCDALSHDGCDLAAALQTIREIGFGELLDDAVAQAFPGSTLQIDSDGHSRLQVALATEGILRPLMANELSDGTLRYLCLLAALMSPRPPELLVLNEPESSLHPELLEPLARQIAAASQRGQVWVITHSRLLATLLEDRAGVTALHLLRESGETRIEGQGLLDEPLWP